MERVEVVGCNIFVLRTKQLGPNSWCCDLFERYENPEGEESFLFEEFGESEIETIAMALSDAQEPQHQHHLHPHR
jgi:hypothetical protein